MSALQRLGAVVLLLTLFGCSLETARLAGPQDRDQVPPAATLPRPIVGRFQGQVQADLERHVPREQAVALDALAGARSFPAGFKRPLIVLALTDPWRGMLTIEQSGHHVAELIRSGTEHLPALIQTLEAGMDRHPEAITPLPIPTGSKAEEHVAALVSVLEEAHRLRAAALRKLSPQDRRFLFDHAASFVEHFYPNVSLTESPNASELSEQTLAEAEADRRFCEFVSERLDYGALIAAAQVLARLADDGWLERLGESVRDRQALPSPPNGVTGDVLLLRETPYGLLVIGGEGSNTYDLDERFALVLDLGGNDTYRGTIAAAAGMEHGNSVVIDLAGNDTYEASPLGLATGRLGVGLLIDRAGDDVYHLSQGSGGTGFAGLGILYDGAGNDHYVGTKLTQGAALGGLGLLVDAAGDDRHTSFGYAIGFGGPLGIGAVIDREGDDRYQSGEKYPSSYNAGDAPDEKPGEPRFQFDSFGIGTGSGKRIFTKDPEQQSYGLAGGWGMVIDLAGKDRYRSSNFSQGAGYFFGAGVKLDFGGHDEHAAARFGHAAGAHYGVGLFVDYGGEDRYSSTGPVYNGGTAWDLSAMLCIDAGQDSDVYDLRRSDGLGRADHHSWSLFIEEHGKDRYLVSNGMGRASDASMSGFFDLGGEDTYVVTPQPGSGGRANGHTEVDGSGGLFVDR